MEAVMVDEAPAMAGKTVLVTGATGGIRKAVTTLAPNDFVQFHRSIGGSLCAKT
jgi:hypothetical protein